MLLVALIVIDELLGPVLFRYGLVQAGEIDASAPRPLIVVSNREPYLHNYDSSGRVNVECGDRRRRRGARLADARARRRLDRARRRQRRPRRSSTRRTRSACRRRARRTSCAVSGWRNASSAALLRRLRQRRAVAALASGRRAADVPPRGLVGVPVGERALRRGDRRGADDGRHPGVHPGLPSRPRRAATARAAACRQDGAVLAHPVAVSGPSADLPWRRELLEGLLANDFLAFQLERDRRNFVAAVEDELDAEIEADGARIRVDGRSTTVVSVPIGVDYDRIQATANDASLALEQQRLIETVWPARAASSGWASIGSTTPRASPSVSPRSIAC